MQGPNRGALPENTILSGLTWQVNAAASSPDNFIVQKASKMPEGGRRIGDVI
jgi:hypothetical protein